MNAVRLFAPRFARRFLVLPLALLACAAVFAFGAHAAPVLMISIDGLKPEYITEADVHGMKIPYLRTLLAKGTYADGVVGIWPTITYPSHTTLITGVWPVEHGIYNNHEFDPFQQYFEAWNWYASEIRAPTLWQVAHHAGLRTASVGWPVSVGATDVDYLIPSTGAADASSSYNPVDQLLMEALSRPDTLIQQLKPAAGPYMNGNDTSIAGDEMKTRYAVEILRRYKPAFMTLHLSSLDETQHQHGPFSPEACADLEALDGMIARLAHQVFANNPSAVLVIVSDHGFMNVSKSVNLAIPFLQAGLINVTMAPGKTPVVKSWKAEPWMAGGMAAIMLHDPADHATEQQVKAMLDGLAADPANGIAEILDRDAIKKRGAFPDAAFLVVLKPGYYTANGSAAALLIRIPAIVARTGFRLSIPRCARRFSPWEPASRIVATLAW
jgi:predicted AlkP superfamily pyrophosphatase or phosphodiesterase